MTKREGGQLAPGATLPHATVTWTATDLPSSCSVLEAPIVDPRHYTILREVARGGIGRILEAIDTRLQREVALKELLRPRRTRPGSFTRRSSRPDCSTRRS